MRAVFTSHGWDDYRQWLTAGGTDARRVNRLIDAAVRDPFAGIGSPEQLRARLPVIWSRRITAKHRLVYLVDGDDLVILQARYRYS